MKIRAIRDYFHLYIASAQDALPEVFFAILIVVMCVTAILSFSVSGAKKGLHALLVVALIEVVAMIYCYTVFFRSYTENSGVNLVPFWSYRMESQDLQCSMYVENLMNVLMFVPFGLLLGCSFKGITWKVVLLVTLFVSVSIESLQYFLKRGFVEFDDVFHNMIGAFLGFGLYAIFAALGRFLFHDSNKCKDKATIKVE